MEEKIGLNLINQALGSFILLMLIMKNLIMFMEDFRTMVSGWEVVLQKKV